MCDNRSFVTPGLSLASKKYPRAKQAPECHVIVHLGPRFLAQANKVLTLSVDSVALHGKCLKLLPLG